MRLTLKQQGELLELPPIISVDKRDLDVMRALGSGDSVAQAADKVGMAALSICRRNQEIKRRVRSAIARARRNEGASLR